MSPPDSLVFDSAPDEIVIRLVVLFAPAIALALMLGILVNCKVRGSIPFSLYGFLLWSLVPCLLDCGGCVMHGEGQRVIITVMTGLAVWAFFETLLCPDKRDHILSALAAVMICAIYHYRVAYLLMLMGSP